MDLEGVREALLKRPFEPFSIRLADGRSLAVRHPEMVAVGKRRIVVVQPDDSTLFIEPLLIVSLDFNGERPGQTDHRPKDDT
jgi:virulence-associated protein VagC